MKRKSRLFALVGMLGLVALTGAAGAINVSPAYNVVGNASSVRRRCPAIFDDGVVEPGLWSLKDIYHRTIRRMTVDAR